MAADNSAGDSAETKLYIFGTAISAEELENRRDHWDVDGEDMCSTEVIHGTISEAPSVARELAQSLHSLMPDLEDVQMMMSSESSDGGEIIVISNPGPDPKAACLKALGIAEANMEIVSKAANTKDRDWSEYTKLGLNLEPDEWEDLIPEEEYEEEEDMARFQSVVAGTKVMAEKLKDGFLFNLNANIAVGPVIFGGYASDGNIVGVLSSRVWT